MTNSLDKKKEEEENNNINVQQPNTIKGEVINRTSWTQHYTVYQEA